MTGASKQGTGLVAGAEAQQSLRILAVHRYFWPDAPPYASMLRRIVEQWHRDGHQVEVLSAQPSYKSLAHSSPRPRAEDLGGVLVRRLALPGESGRPLIRILNAIRLGTALLWRALTHRFDLIMISTAPPVLGGVAAAVAARLTGARFVYHCMDIHPEVGGVSGDFSNPLVFGLLRKLDTWSCRRADPVVVLSSDMADTLRARPGGESLHIEILNNFSLPSERDTPTELPFPWPAERFTVLFAGNIGRFQGLDVVVEAMGYLKHRDDIEFVMMGDGAAREGLERKSAAIGARIRFLGHQPVEIAKAAMQRASMGFVSLTAGVFRYAYPSKTMTYLEQGCPLIVAVETESSLAGDVVAGGYGFVVAPDDSRGLSVLLERLADDRGRADSMRVAAARQAQDQFSERGMLGRWSRLAQREEATAK